MNLESLNLTDLQHIEAGQFIQRLFKDTEELKLDLNKDPIIADYMEELRPAFKQFNLALLQIAEQEETEEIFDLDIARDHCISALRRLIESHEYDTEEEIKKAYSNAGRIMKKYKGIESSNYEAESLEIENLLTEWGKDENGDYIITLGLQLRIGRLDKAADAFNVKFGNRSVNVTVKEKYNTKALRKAMLTPYRALAEYTLVMAKQKNADPFYIAFLDSLNHIRKYFADLLARREGGKKGDDGVKDGGEK